MSFVLAPSIFLAFGYEPDNTFLVCVNLLLCGESVGLMFFGDAAGTNPGLKLGFVFFFLLAVFQYFNDEWEYLIRSAFFVGGGLLLLALGYFLEKRRRQEVVKFEVGEAS